MTKIISSWRDLSNLPINECTTVIISPNAAKEGLQSYNIGVHGKGNRPLIESNVQELIDCIKSNKWVPSSVFAVYVPTLAILDCQHRLTAISRLHTQLPVTVYPTTDKNYGLYVDQLGRTRNTHAITAVAGVSVDKVTATVAKRLMLHEKTMPKSKLQANHSVVSLSQDIDYLSREILTKIREHKPNLSLQNVLTTVALLKVRNSGWTIEKANRFCESFLLNPVYMEWFRMCGKNNNAREEAETLLDFCDRIADGKKPKLPRLPRR